MPSPFKRAEPQPDPVPTQTGGLGNFVAKTMHGLEPVLMDELQALGATNIRPLKRAVTFNGDKRLLYRANYELRSALRILVPIHTFPAEDERAFYNAVRDVDWGQYMDVTDTLAVEAIAAGDVFRHSQYMALCTKDAIVDQFRDRFGRRPDVNTVAPVLRVHVRIHGKTCDLLLDASGESLHRRGYRRDTVDAPLNEVLAAGMILLSGWNGLGSFVDPMCGSGTLPIEAAMIATARPPQHMRELFGFFRWKNFDKKCWLEVKKEADSRAQNADFPILASDKDPRARNATTINIMSSGLEDVILVEKTPFEKLTPPEPPGTLITNPPYDERLQMEAIEAFYKNIGDTFKKNWPGWNAWVISSNREALKNIGLRSSRKITLFNGALECSFQKFDLYAGSKKGGGESTE